MKKGTLSAIVVILLAAIIVLVCGIGSSWFTNGDIATWFNSWGKGEEQEDPTDEDEQDGGAPVTDENGNEVTSDEIVSMPRAMTFRSAAALDGETAEYDSVTLKINVEPSYALVESVSYSAVWVNADSEWATGKSVSDYLTVTQSEEDDFACVVQCLQPFGEQIKVVGEVFGGSGSQKSAECTVDFMKRIVSVAVEFNGSPDLEASMSRSISSTDGLAEAPDYMQGVSFYRDFFSMKYTAYTVDCDYNVEELTVSGTQEMVEVLAASEFASGCTTKSRLLHEADPLAFNLTVMDMKGTDDLYDFPSSSEENLLDILELAKSVCDEVPLVQAEFHVYSMDSGLRFRAVSKYLVSAEYLTAAVENVTFEQGGIVI